MRLKDWRSPITAEAVEAEPEAKQLNFAVKIRVTAHDAYSAWCVEQHDDLVLALVI